MPTARELLEQADALMRRNRKRGKRKAGDPPTLTDVLGVDRSSALAPTVILPGSDAPAEADPISLDTLADVPVLTDVIDVWPAGEERPAAAAAAAPALNDALEADALAAAARDQSITVDERVPSIAVPDDKVASDAVARDTVSVAADASSDEGRLIDVRSDAPLSEPAVPPPLDEEFILDIPPRSETPAQAAPLDAPLAAVGSALQPGTREWDSLAEEIRMQVLQRLDLFTDTGLRDKLGERLRPIVDRASAELVETINREIGELVRGYVAEAIEREIESWRKRS